MFYFKFSKAYTVKLESQPKTVCGTLDAWENVESCINKIL